MLHPLLYILILSVTIQTVYFLYYFILKPLKNRNLVLNEGISVIICAHNEYSNLKKILPLFLEQEHPNFEIILVNDRSTDKTKKFLDAFSHPNLKTLHIQDTPENWNSKKWALSQAAKASKHEYLLFSDADCYPKSTKWIQEMVQGFQQAETVVGYSGYEKEASFLNSFIQYETYVTAISYLGFANKNINYMAVGRNFGIKKETYLSFNFSKYKHLQGGDDDLTVNHLNKKTVPIYSLQSHTVSIPKATIKEYLTQKMRHINIGKHYTFTNKVRITLFNLSSLLFYFCFFFLMINNIHPEITIGLFVLRTSVLFYNIVVGFRTLGIDLKHFEVLWLDFFYILFLWFFGPIALLAKKVKWK